MAVVAGAVASAAMPAAASAAPTITEFTTGLTAGAGPNVIAPGPSGTMWATEYEGDRIARIGADGTITEFPTAGPAMTAGAHPSGVVADNGEIWFTEFGTGEIGELDPSSGRILGEYPVPAGPSSEPEGIIVGPDGALWFTERGAGQIGRLDPSLATPGTSNGFSEFAIPTDGSHIVPQPVDLVEGSGGTIWVTLINAGVASVVPAGSGVDTTATITRYLLPTAATTSEPEGITIGPDGDPWVAEYGAARLAQINPAAVQAGTSDGITEDPIGGHPLWLASGGDGALWATDNTDSELLRYDPTAGTTTVFAAAQGVHGDATSDAVDSAGNVWFTEFQSDRIGEVALPTSHPTTPTTPTETLTIDMTGSGTGAVSGSAACAKPDSATDSCQATFPYGTVVTLSGSPTSGSTFLGWLSNPPSALCVLGTCTITMDGDVSVNAYFESAQTVTAQLVGSGQGYVTDGPPGISLNVGLLDCVKPPAGPQTCTKNYTFGTEVTLRAVPVDGSTFAGWSGPCTGVGSCSVLMDSPQSVTATFTYDPGVHVNAIEVTQGIQTDELPTRTTAEGYAVSYHGVAISSYPPPAPGTANPDSGFAELADDHATVVRVYVNTQESRHGQPVPTMTLRAYRDGKLLAPGPIGPDQIPNSNAVPVGALGSVLNADGTPQRDDNTSAYTFTLPSGWAEGHVTFDATVDPDPYQFPSYCPNQECLDGGIELEGSDFLPVTHADIDPVAILVGGKGPQGYSPRAVIAGAPRPAPLVDPAWGLVQDVIPFPLEIGPYGGVLNATTQVTGCDGQVQGNQTGSQYNQSVYAARDSAVLALLTSWASKHDTSVSSYPFGLVPAGTKSACPGASSFSGGLSLAGRALGTTQPESISTDDRPWTGIAHEFEHGLGLPHAGNLCNSGTVGTAETLTGSTTAGSTTLALSGSTSGLAVGQPISGPGLYAGTEIYSVGSSSVTLTQKAQSTTSNQSYVFSTGTGQVGSVWPPVQQSVTTLMGDGWLDGVGLVGLENPANSPYTVRGPNEAGVPGHEFFDLMSYCTGGSEALGWISVRNWDYDVGFNNPAAVVLARRGHRTVRLPAESVPLAIRAPVFRTEEPASSAQTRSLAVTSIYDIATGTTVLTQAAPDAGAPTPPSSNATYTLTARNAAGQVIASAGTDDSLVHIDPGGGNGADSMILIQGKIAASDAREIDVLQSGHEIGTDRAPRQPPVVTLVGLRAGSRIGGAAGAIVRWRASSSSGRQLQITIDYSADGGRDWQTVYEGDNDGSATLPGDLFAASRNARLRVTASDGFNAAIVISPPLVSPGIPPLVQITDPSSAIVVPADGAVDLAGVAYDGPGRRLSGRALMWRIGRQLLGYGDRLTTAAVRAGRHTVTLTARGAGGRTATVSARVTVVAAPPTLTDVTAPHRISSHARSLTLRVAADEAATLQVGRRRLLVDRTPRTITLPVSPGRSTLTLKLVVRSGAFSATQTLAVARS